MTEPTKLDPCPWCEQSLDFSDGNTRIFCAWCAQFATLNVPPDAVELQLQELVVGRAS